MCVSVYLSVCVCVCVRSLGRAWFVSYSIGCACPASEQAITYNFCARLASMEFFATIARSLCQVRADCLPGSSSSSVEFHDQAPSPESSPSLDLYQFQKHRHRVRVQSLFPFVCSFPDLSLTLILHSIPSYPMMPRSLSAPLSDSLRARSCRVLHWLPFVTPP